MAFLAHVDCFRIADNPLSQRQLPHAELILVIRRGVKLPRISGDSRFGEQNASLNLQASAFRVRGTEGHRGSRVPLSPMTDVIL